MTNYPFKTFNTVDCEMKCTDGIMGRADMCHYCWYLWDCEHSKGWDLDYPLNKQGSDTRHDEELLTIYYNFKKLGVYND